jgi:glutamyl-tRNA synthetase
LAPEEVLRRLGPFLEEPLPEGRELVAVEAVRDEMRVLTDASRLVREITAPVDPSAFVHELPESSEKVFAHVAETLEDRQIEEVEVARAFVGELRSWAKGEGIKTRDVLHPLRLALTGRDRGPEMAYLFAVLGPEEARERIERAREAIIKV